MLAEIISNQASCLHTLNLNENCFSSLQTEKLLTRIAECGVCRNLEELGLESSTNFDLDESVRKFADILAIAPVLKECDIRYQYYRGDRKISVNV